MVYTFIDHRMTSKCSHLKWNDEPQANILTSLLFLVRDRPWKLLFNCFFAITLTVFDDHFHFHFLHQVISVVYNLLDHSSRPISAQKIAQLFSTFFLIYKTRKSTPGVDRPILNLGQSLSGVWYPIKWSSNQSSGSPHCLIWGSTTRSLTLSPAFPSWVLFCFFQQTGWNSTLHSWWQISCIWPL